MTALQNPNPMVIIWDLSDPSGPAQVQLHHTSAQEWMARDAQARYVEKLPQGTAPGPKVGLNRIIIDPDFGA
jgi:hypothetical protein